MVVVPERERCEREEGREQLNQRNRIYDAKYFCIMMILGIDCDGLDILQRSHDQRKR